MKLFNLRKACVFLTAVLIEILIFAFINLATGLIFALIAIVGFIIYYGICLFKKKKSLKIPYPHRERLTAIAIFCIGLIAVLMSIDINETKVEKREFNQENVVMTARICANGNGYDDKGTIVGKYVLVDEIVIMGKHLDGKAKVFIDQEHFVGQVLKFKGNITTSERDFTSSYSMSAYNDGIFYEIVTNENTTIEIVSENNFHYDEKIKLGVKKILYSNTDSNTAEFMFSLLFGNSKVMNSVTTKAFSATGISHIIAVSGLHIALLSGAVIFILTKLRFNRWLVLMLNTAFVVGYSAICGFPPSVIRASLTITLILLARCLGKRVDTLSIISICASLILLFRIEMLFDLGYLLSFSAVFGLCILYKPLIRLKPKHCPRFIAESISSSLAVNICILPILIYYFDKVNTVFILANLLITPIVGLLFPLFIPLLAIAALIPQTGVLLTGIGYVFSLLIAIIVDLASIPFPTIKLISNGGMITYYLLTLFALSGFSLIRKKGKKVILVVLIGVMTLNLCWTGVLNSNNTMYVQTMQDYPVYYSYVSSQKASVLYIEGEIEYEDLALIREFLTDKTVDIIMKKEVSKSEAMILTKYCLLEKVMLVTDKIEDYHHDYFSKLGGEIEYKDLKVNIDTVSVKCRDATFDFSRKDGAKLAVKYESKELLIGANSSDNKIYYPTDFTFWVRHGRIIKQR